ncbi:Hypothetical protein GLP15_4472 [Giardia lamblia P15]|uniref:Uncharacterized protein n=1 Tax=Giardia intestinalis (strain P15) TaxID=658858 RepID=E1F800_GIAIA|nr:Hypothetical protein GLP15_4472 [Giardia lamblia P15]
MDPSYSSYSTYSSYSSYSSYSYSFVDDHDDYPNPMTTATQPFHVASSPQAHYIALAPESPKREDKKTSPLAEKSSPKQKRASPGRSGFEFDANSLNFFSAQTAAAVSAAVSAAINHQINQNILLAPSTSAAIQPPSILSQQTSVDAAPDTVHQEQSPPDATQPPTTVDSNEKTVDTYTIYSPNRAKNATSEDFVLISPAQSRHALRQPTKEQSPSSESSVEKVNLALAELKDKYMSLSAEFRDYKLKKENEIKDLMAHEAELRQEARIYQRDLQKLEKDYTSMIAKLAEKEDKIVELRAALKKLENTLQQRPPFDVAPSREQSTQQGYNRKEVSQPKESYSPPASQPAVVPYKPVDSMGKIFGPTYADSNPVDSFKHNPTGKETAHTLEPKASHPSPSDPPVATSNDVPIMSFEEFLRQRARNAAIEELQQRDTQAKEAMDAKIASLQKQLGSLLTAQPEATPSEGGREASHTKTTFMLEDVDKTDPNYKLIQAMEADYTAMCQQLMLNRDELANLEGRSGKRTHKEMMRMRFLEAQISKLDSEANQLRSRLRALTKAKN